jgi:hypothetical protein
MIYLALIGGDILSRSLGILAVCHKETQSQRYAPLLRQIYKAAGILKSQCHSDVEWEM